MSKKKILKIIGIILLVIIVAFLIHSIRNFIIISKLQDKAIESIKLSTFTFKSSQTILNSNNPI